MSSKEKTNKPENETKTTEQVSGVKMQKKGISLNFLGILTLVLVLVFVVLYALDLNGIFDKKQNVLELNGIEFVSDENIVQQLIDFKDANKIFVYGKIDKDRKNMISVGGTITLYIQILSALQKPFSVYSYYEQDLSCHVFDADKNKRGVFSKDYCDNITSNDGKILIIKEPDSSLTKPRLVIEKNVFYFYSKDSKSIFYDNHNFLAIIVPELAKIEKLINDYIGTVGNKLS